MATGSLRRSTIEAAAAEGVGVYPIGPYFFRPPRRAGLILGYAPLTERQIRSVANYREYLERLAGRGTETLSKTAEEKLLRSWGMRENRLGKIRREGLSADRIDALVEGYEKRLLAERAEAIARTITIDASAEGQNLLWQQAIDDGLLDETEWEVVWSAAVGSERTCERCLAMDGKTRPINGTYPGGVGHPALHVQCLPSETLVSARGLLAASKRLYDGPLVIICTASGKELRVTPNHPVLTSRGWVAAGELKKGGDVISALRPEFITAGVRDSHDMPASIEQVVEAFARSSKALPVEVPTSAPDFHGDGRGGEVAVIWANRELRDEGHTSLCEKHAKGALFLAYAHKAGLIGYRALALFLQRVLASARSSMRSSDLLLPLGVGHAGPFDGFAFALASAGHPGFNQEPSYNRPRNSESTRDGVFGNTGEIDLSDFRLGQIGSWVSHPARSHAMLAQDTKDNNGGAPEFTREAGAALAGHVFSDNIVLVNVQSYRGHVYNLETEEGWYSAGGIITHNCRCSEYLRRIKSERGAA